MLQAGLNPSQAAVTFSGPCKKFIAPWHPGGGVADHTRRAVTAEHDMVAAFLVLSSPKGLRLDHVGASANACHLHREEHKARLLCTASTWPVDAFHALIIKSLSMPDGIPSVYHRGKSYLAAVARPT